MSSDYPSAMHRLLSRFGALFLTLALAACIPESQNPVGDPGAAVKEPGLNGLWQTDWEDGRLFLHIFDGGQGMVEVYTVNHKPDGTGEADHYEGFISTVGNRRIANLQSVDTGGEDSGGAATYVFLAYELQPEGKLVVHFVDDKPFIAAVTAGKLQGQVTGEGDSQTVLVSDDTAKVAKFIAATDDATLYGKALLFHRVYPANK
jgi:hypothetical protein